MVLDRRLDIVTANRACLASTGRRLDDIVGRWAWDAFPTDPATLRQAIARKALLVAVTGYGRPQDREASLAAGFDHRLAKPVDIPQLLALLAQLEYRTCAVSYDAGMTIFHPKQNEHGEPVAIATPGAATALSNWLDPALAATVIPAGAMPASLNGIAFRPWTDAPQDDAAWASVAGQDAIFGEPEYEPVPGMRIAAGVAIEEADGRIWVVHPSNAFGGYAVTFPKGSQDRGVPLRATAIREAFEESGLRVVLTGFLADLTRSRSRTRYYLGRRVGGCPADMGWESQAVSLVPRAQLATVLLNPNDALLLDLLRQA